MTPYPKRLIEVDLPIKRISAHARREKSIRHGHISTLHIWWARRPLAACRAVICAALWPDPADELCPPAFRQAAAKALCDFAEKVRTDSQLAGLCKESWQRWVRTNSAALRADDPLCWPDMRYALLDFIADFANWDASTVPAFLETARALTQTAHEALGGAPGTRPLVVDPFAGGGSIPLEALRVGADAFASDLNPVAVLLNKVVLEYIPKYGQRLADEVRKWGQWVREQAEKELAEFYPKDPDGSVPIAYLWARTIRCEGPGCGAEVPLIRSLWLAKRGDRSVALRLVPRPAEKRVDFEIIRGAEARDVGEGTVRRGSATCPCCGFTTPVASVRMQLRERRGGADDARLFCVVTKRSGEQRRHYRLPNERDVAAIEKAAREARVRGGECVHGLSVIPDEPLPPTGTLGFRVQLYGMLEWRDLFASRQLVALTTLSRLVSEVERRLADQHEPGLAAAVQIVLAMALDKQADLGNSLNRWEPVAECPRQLFGRQAVPIIWDYAESVPLGQSSGAFSVLVDGIVRSLAAIGSDWSRGHAEQGDATACRLPDDATTCVFTDPPYYDAVPYGDLSDFFYVWLKRTLPSSLNPILADLLTPKDRECVVDPIKGKDRAYFERSMAMAMSECRRVLDPSGLGVVVFAHKTTSGWEALLQAVVEAGWTITGSWPVDTENASRLRAQDSAALASSVHLVCRPRENPNGSLREGDVGDWRDVLDELPKRIHDWLPRLMREGVVGADAIFACLGPALEIFSRYSRVERASGEQVKLGEYLEHVWAAVAREALSLLFEGADATGLEADARLTAMWLWTLSSGQSNGGKGGDEGEDEGDEESGNGKKAANGRYVLEFDAARKIAQGLGVHLDELGHVVEVKGEYAWLLTVAERRRYLFGDEKIDVSTARGPKARLQTDMFAQLGVPEPRTRSEGPEAPRPGATVLDRVHQAMLLFAAGRSEALRRFLVEGGAGQERTFWSLAQSLSALYPAGSDEKRWVDGVLARKKGMGF